MGNINTLICLTLALSLFGCSSNQTTQIGDNTFVHKEKVYKIVDNEITEIGDLSSKIRKFEISKPVKKEYGNADLSYIKSGATTNINALYRGNILYFNLNIEGLNDLKENYYPGQFTVNFKDEFGFIIHQTEIPTNELIGMVGEANKVLRYDYSGKTEMSSDIYKAITSYSVSSSVREKNRNAWGD